MKFGFTNWRSYLEKILQTIELCVKKHLYIKIYLLPQTLKSESNVVFVWYCLLFYCVVLFMEFFLIKY